MDARVPPRALAGGLATLVAAASDPVAPSWLRKLRRDKAMGALLPVIGHAIGGMILTLSPSRRQIFLAREERVMRNQIAFLVKFDILSLQVRG
jgi:hypothetical protein